VNVDQAVVDLEGELLSNQRPVWKRLFSDPQFRGATMVFWGKVQTVGGKDLNDKVMQVSCDRRANAQINWDRVDAHGIKTLCDYRALVTFDRAADGGEAGKDGPPNACPRAPDARDAAEQARRLMSLSSNEDVSDAVGVTGDEVGRVRDEGDAAAVRSHAAAQTGAVRRSAAWSRGHAREIPGRWVQCELLPRWAPRRVASDERAPPLQG
jgi:hypothetical protein